MSGWTSGEDSAFLIPDVSIDFTPGLTKREYFAAQALQGYLAAHAGDCGLPSPQRASQDCIDYADALIVALNESRNLAGLPEGKE